MVYKLDIVHKKYYYNKRIKLVRYELIETDKTACYDYDRGTSWKKEGNDWSSTYRMAAYFKNIESRKIFLALDDESQKQLAERLAEEWQMYLDYYTMKLILRRESNRVFYDLSKSGIVGSGHAYGNLYLKFKD